MKRKEEKKRKRREKRRKNPKPFAHVTQEYTVITKQNDKLHNIHGFLFVFLHNIQPFNFFFSVQGRKNAYVQ